MAKYQFLKNLPKLSHIHKNRYLSNIIVMFLDQLLLPYKFQESSMRGRLFFNFASCEPLSRYPYLRHQNDHEQCPMCHLHSHFFIKVSASEIHWITNHGSGHFNFHFCANKDSSIGSANKFSRKTWSDLR